MTSLVIVLLLLSLALLLLRGPGEPLPPSPRRPFPRTELWRGESAGWVL